MLWIVLELQTLAKFHVTTALPLGLSDLTGRMEFRSLGMQCSFARHKETAAAGCVIGVLRSLRADVAHVGPAPIVFGSTPVCNQQLSKPTALGRQALAQSRELTSHGDQPIPHQNPSRTLCSLNSRDEDRSTSRATIDSSQGPARLSQAIPAPTSPLYHGRHNRLRKVPNPTPTAPLLTHPSSAASRSPRQCCT
jgi:hypothetical protein